MSKETVEMMIEGGKAVANAAVGQKLGPLRVNIQDILKQINERTSALKGMKVPVKIIVDKDTKEVNLSIGTPPASELIKSELKLEKGSGKPDKDKIANISIEQVIKITKMKQESLMAKNLKAAVKTIIGSCNALGILIEGKTSKEISKDINAGMYDKEINEVKIEINDEKIERLKHQLENVRQELAKLLAKEAAEEEKLKEKVIKKEEKVEAVEEVKEEKGKEVKGKEVKGKEGKEDKKVEAVEKKEEKKEVKKK